MVDVLLRDMLYGWRTLVARPSFAMASVLTLALGIGASTAIFAVADRTLLSPVRLPDTDRLFAIREFSAERPRPDGLSGPAYQQIAAATELFEDTAAFQSNQLALIQQGSPELIWGFDVTPNFFAWLHATPLLGRTFGAADVATGRRAVVLSHGFWQRRFGGDPGVVGRTIPLSNETFTPSPGTLVTTSVVVGVMPAGFEFPGSNGGRTDFWKAVDLAATQYTRPSDRLVRNWTGIVRLRPGVTPDGLRAALGTIAGRNVVDFPKTSQGWSFDAVPLAHLFSTADFRVTVISLAVAVGIVLLLACANVANLAITRAESRRREFAIRTAIGAGRGRLVRQLLAESAVLAVAGSAIGGLVALWGIDALSAHLPASLPRLQPMGFDARTFGFMALLGAVVTIAFGLIPAWHASGRKTLDTLKPAALSPTRDGRAFRSGLVFCQVTMSVLVLFAAGLLFQSVSRFLAVKPGYDPRSLVTFMVTHWNLSSAEVGAKLVPITDAFRALPGAESVVVASRGTTGAITAIDRPGKLTVDHLLVGTSGQNFFTTYRMPLVRGRAFTADDAVPGAPGVVVNETLARSLWTGEDPLGRSFVPAQGPGARYDVIGIVGDVVEDPERPPRPKFYEPYERMPRATSYSLYTIRARGDVTPLIPDVRAALWRLDPLTIPPQMILLENSFRGMVAPRESLLELLSFFALVAAALTAIGIYGVVAQAVASRTREIGLRLALGAQRAHVARLIIGQGARVVGVGVAAGLVAAPLVGRYLQSKLFGIGSSDPATLIGVAGLLGLVGVAACAMPARRAARVDPSVSLRAD